MRLVRSFGRRSLCAGFLKYRRSPDARTYVRAYEPAKDSASDIGHSFLVKIRRDFPRDKSGLVLEWFGCEQFF